MKYDKEFCRYILPLSGDPVDEGAPTMNHLVLRMMVNKKSGSLIIDKAVLKEVYHGESGLEMSVASLNVEDVVVHRVKEVK